MTRFGFHCMLMLVLTSCAHLPLQKSEVTRRLLIRNPHQFEVWLHRVGGDSVELGDSSIISLDLQADLYWIESGGLKYPAPLLEEVSSAGEKLQITLIELPEPQPGFVFVPPGPCLVGDVLGVGAVDERPARIEDVGALFVATHETTNAEYTHFLNSIGRCDEHWIDINGPKCLIEQSAQGRFETQSPEFPVVTVTFDGALQYVRWKSEETGKTFRLPTEIEWEKIARGPQSSTYAYGDIYLPDAANQESGKLNETKSFPPTGWGVYDATGNAFEWTSSLYKPGLFVLRGGSYVLDGPYLRNSFRMWYRPQVQADDIGFRVVQEYEE